MLIVALLQTRGGVLPENWIDWEWPILKRKLAKGTIQSIAQVDAYNLKDIKYWNKKKRIFETSLDQIKEGSEPEVE